MFQLVAFKIHGIIKTACFNCLPLISTRNSYWEVFLEINLNQKTLKFYASWVHWKNQCRSTVRRHSLLCNKHEYQHFDIFVKNIFSPFMALVFFCEKPEGAWCFQGALKKICPMKWVKSHLIFSYLLLLI